MINGNGIWNENVNDRAVVEILTKNGTRGQKRAREDFFNRNMDSNQGLSESFYQKLE